MQPDIVGESESERDISILSVVFPGVNGKAVDFIDQRYDGSGFFVSGSSFLFRFIASQQIIFLEFGINLCKVIGVGAVAQRFGYRNEIVQRFFIFMQKCFSEVGSFFQFGSLFEIRLSISLRRKQRVQKDSYFGIIGKVVFGDQKRVAFADAVKITEDDIADILHFTGFFRL